MEKFQKWPERQIAIYAFIVNNKALLYICICKPVKVKKKKGGGGGGRKVTVTDLNCVHVLTIWGGP